MALAPDESSVGPVRNDSSKISLTLETSLMHFNGEVTNLDSTTLLAADRALAVSLASVRERLNGLCAINRLPPELLAMIFYHVPMTYQHVSPWESNVQACSNLLPITYVCKHWRAVVLGAPYLWSHVTPIFPAQISLSRSRNLPLRVYITYDSHRVLEEILQSRRPILELCCEGDHIYGRMPSDYSASHLESFTLANYNSPGETLRNITLFDGKVPRLQELALATSNWPLPSHPLPALRRLSVDACNNIQISALVRVFSSSPYLEHLVVRGSDLMIDHLTTKPIHMDRLETIYIKTISTQAATGILSSVSVNPGTAVYLSGIDTLVIPRSHCKPDACRVAIWQTAEKIILAATGSSTAIWSTCKPGDTIAAHGAAFDAMQKLPLEKVTELWMEDLLPISALAQHLNALLRALTNVATLYIHIPHASYIIQHLMDDESNPPLCPRLATLYMHSDLEGDDSEIDIDFICELAERRKRIGHPIPKVVIDMLDQTELTDPDFQEDIDRLKKSVGKVDLARGGKIAMDMPVCCDTCPHHWWRPWSRRWWDIRNGDTYDDIAGW